MNFYSSHNSSHYNTCSTNYSYHVLSIGAGRFCIGCLASKLFLVIFLPILLFIFFDPIFNIQLLILLIIIPQLISLLYQIITGRERKIPKLRLLYTGLTHYYILVNSVDIAISETKLLFGIFLLIIPQFSIYIYKIISFNEFRYPKLKLIIRLGFINAYFLTLIYLKFSLKGGLLLILITVILFYKMRSISSSVVRSNGGTYLRFKLTKNQEILNPIINAKYNIFNRNSRILLRSNRGGVSDVLKTVFIILGIIFLLMIGIAVFSMSNNNSNCSPDCNCSSSNNSNCCDCTSNNEPCCNC